MINSNNIVEKGVVVDYGEESFACEWEWVDTSHPVLCYLDDDATFSSVIVTDWAKKKYRNRYYPFNIQVRIPIVSWHD